MLFFIFILLSSAFKINEHIPKHQYKEVHPLFDSNHVPPRPPMILKKGEPGSRFKDNDEYSIVSLHDNKFYDNVTWIIQINKKDAKCQNHNILDSLKIVIPEDGCFLYSSLILNKNILIKLGCPISYSNVFLKPKNATACQRTVKVRKEYYYKDLRELIKTPLLNNTMKFLNDCYGQENILLEKNYAYVKPKSKALKNVFANYYYHKNQYSNQNFTRILNYPVSEEWKKLYSDRAFQNLAPWHLSRIDQRFGLDQVYHYNNGCDDLNAVIIDTGILTTHVEFGGRATFLIDTSGEGATTATNGHGILFIFKIKIFTFIPFHKSIKCFTWFC